MIMCSAHLASQAVYALDALAVCGQGHTLTGMTYKDFLKSFGATVKHRRKALHKTQPELADSIDGLDQGGISRIENGLQGFDSDTLFQIAAALDMPVYQLFGGIGLAGAKAEFPPEVVDIMRELHHELMPADLVYILRAWLMLMQRFASPDKPLSPLAALPAPAAKTSRTSANSERSHAGQDSKTAKPAANRSRSVAGKARRPKSGKAQEARKPQ